MHGLLHLVGFDHEISEEAEVEMEKEEELLLKSLEWKGKGLIQSAIDAETNSNSAAVVLDGNYVVVCFIVLLMTASKFLCDYYFFFFSKKSNFHWKKMKEYKGKPKNKPPKPGIQH